MPPRTAGAAPRLVEDQEDAPDPERQPADDRRRLIHAPRRHRAPRLAEGGDADAGTRAAIQQLCNLAGIAFQAEESRNSRADRQTELRPRTKADMVRYCRLDTKRQVGAEAIMADHPLCIGSCPFGIGAGDREPLAGHHRHARHRRSQGNPEAAEAAAQIAVKIDKTRMQPAGNGHGYAIDRARSRRVRSSAEVRIAALVVSEYHDPFTADLPERCQALRLSPMETPVDGRERARLQRG
jgi:hypothetical protein